MAEKNTFTISRDEWLAVREMVLKEVLYSSLDSKLQDFGAAEQKDSYKSLKILIQTKLEWLVKHHGIESIKKRLNATGNEASVKSLLTPSLRALRALIYDVNNSEKDSQQFRKSKHTINAYYFFVSGKFRNEYLAAHTKLNSNPESPNVHWNARPNETEIARSRDERLEELILKAVNPDSLQFVGVFRSSKYRPGDDVGVLVVSEILSAESVKKYLFGSSPSEKLNNFYEIAPIIDRAINLLDEDIKAKLHQGDLQRTILDVEQGGLIYYKIMGSAYLLGANLNQRTMKDSEDRMHDLYVALNEYYGLGIG